MKKPEDYILEAAKNKKEASEQLDKEMKKANKHFDNLINVAMPEEKEKAMQAASKAKAILEKVKQGGDIHDLVKQLQNLKI